MRRFATLFALLALSAIPSSSALRETECTQALFDALICPTVGETAIHVSFWLPDDDDFVCTPQDVTDEACLPREVGRTIESSADRFLAPFFDGYLPEVECTRALITVGVCTDLQLGQQVRNPVSLFDYGNSRLFEFGLVSPALQYERQVSQNENSELQEKKRRPVETSPK